MGRFITFEGIEGSGKTTQIQLLSIFLDERGYQHLITREPGGTPAGDQIRRLVLNPAYGAMSPTCELLLYAAARAQHLDQVIRPALALGRNVLCDRYTDATRAYQGYGRGLSLEWIDQLHRLETLALTPHRTLVLDIDAADALQRARRRDRGALSEETRFEDEDLAFHERVRRGYLELARREPKRIIVVDARGAVEAVQGRLRDAVMQALAA